MPEIGIYDSSLRLEETVIPSPNSVDLARSIGTDYVNRFSNSTPNVAEIFHLNSKVLRRSPIEVPPDREVLYQARDWFYRESYGLSEEDFVPEHADKVRILYQQLESPAAGFLHECAFEPRLSGLLHSVNIFVLKGNTLLKVLPRRDFLWVERNLDAELMQRLSGAFDQHSSRPDFASSTTVFLVGSFWRYMKFFGARGYRMVLMDCGELAHEFEARVNAVRYENFFDAEVDEVLLLDGVEHSVLMALVIPNKGAEVMP